MMVTSEMVTSALQGVLPLTPKGSDNRAQGKRSAALGRERPESSALKGLHKKSRGDVKPLQGFKKQGTCLPRAALRLPWALMLDPVGVFRKGSRNDDMEVSEMWRKIVTVLVVGLVLGGVVCGQYKSQCSDDELMTEVWDARYYWGVESNEALDVMHRVSHIFHGRGEFERARELLIEVVASYIHLKGESHVDTLSMMLELADQLTHLGDCEGAQPLVVKVVEVYRQELGAGDRRTIRAMIDLAGNLRCLRNLAEARIVGESALAISRENLGPRDKLTLSAMGILAMTLSAQGEVSKSRELFKEVWEAESQKCGSSHPSALMYRMNFTAHDEMEVKVDVLGELVSGLGPDDLVTLMAKANLAEDVGAQGDLERAAKMQREVYESLHRKFGSAHPHTLASMCNLAATFYALGDVGQAKGSLEDLFRIRQEAVEINQYKGYGYAYKCRKLLAEVYRFLQMDEEAVQQYIHALNGIESQTRTFAGAEASRSQFKADSEETYREALETLLNLGRKENAHHILERFRAQGVLSLLAERGVVLAEMPPELEERRRDLDAQYDATVFVRNKLDPNRQKDAFAAVLEEQKEIRHKRERLKAAIRRRAPTVAEIEDPQPLTVEQIRPILEPGTLMLSYMVTPEKTYLFALSPNDEIALHEVDVDEITLRNQVARFFGQLRKSTAARTEASMSVMASWLYGKLLADVTEQIAQSERLLIVPDGPLFYVPFGALVGPDGRYLAESKAVHSVVSATVYGHLLKRRPKDANRPTQIAAFGNPLYPKGPVEKNATVRTAMERGAFDGGLLPLPSSGREVVEIGKLYPSARTLLGKDATEENAKALAAGVDVVHLAAHGVADPVTPLDSFVALSVTDEPGRENGRLQAWEIYERVRLDADLVVLSACETAFGPERDGEGLLSLSRAFQVAGARTVVASLWSVADESTAELMIRFYQHLKDGKPKDEALRAAQLEFLAGPVTFVDSKGKEVTRDFSSPYYWAAFQVIGDRK